MVLVTPPAFNRSTRINCFIYINEGSAPKSVVKILRPSGNAILAESIAIREFAIIVHSSNKTPCLIMVAA